MSEFSSYAAGGAFPPIIGLDALSLLINKSPATILMDRCRAPHKIPPACMPPGTKQPLWITADVVAWLASHPEASKETKGTKRQPQAQKKLGPPFKAERIEAERLGLSVRELRAQRALELGDGGGE
ncbi:hypothetical protein [Thiobacillus sp.]